MIKKTSWFWFLTLRNGTFLNSEDSAESQKWQQHVSLLREQYVILFNANSELQQKYAALTAGKGEKGESRFIEKLLATITSLHSQQQYRFVIF